MQSQQDQTQNWNIIGHEHSINILRRALASQRVRHAYLFSGPEHIGKTLLAQRFAQTLLCPSSPTIIVHFRSPFTKVYHWFNRENHPFS